MAEKIGLNHDVRELKLGKSFDPDGKVAYHSLRYDFKPASVDTSKVASLELSERGSVEVTVPHVPGSGTTNTVYKGNKRPIQKECVLIIDHKTGEIKLEKLASTITLKKTRENTLDWRDEALLSKDGWTGAQNKTSVDCSVERTATRLKVMRIRTSGCVTVRGRLSPCGASIKDTASDKGGVSAQRTHTCSSAPPAARCTRDSAMDPDTRADHRKTTDKRTLKFKVSGRGCRDTQLADRGSPSVQESNQHRQTMSRPDGSVQPANNNGRGQAQGDAEDTGTLAVYAEQAKDDIRDLLRGHALQKDRKPYVSGSCHPAMLKTQHPDIFARLEKRLQFPDNALDHLNEYLFREFPEYLVSTVDIVGRVQRLEDITDYVIEQYQRENH